MTIKNRYIISISISVIMVILLLFVQSDNVYAVKSEVDSPSEVTHFSSSDTFSDEYCKANVSGSKMTIEFRTMIPSYEFRLALYGVYPSTKLNDLDIHIPAEQVGTSTTGKAIYGFKYTINFKQTKVPDGEYFIYISQTNDSDDTYEDTPLSGGLFKNLPVSIKKNVPKIQRYTDVIDENARIEAIGADYDPSWYLDLNLEDISFVLKIPGTTTYEYMTSPKIYFIQNLSNQITAGASSDYDKLLKIYEYISGNFYYDSVAFSTHSYQYANPYNNLYNYVYHISSPNSDNEGRVATTCQGYSAMFLALARSQNIPTRFVYGHRVTTPLNNWGTESSIGVRDHWWVESYINGRWIFIDPTTGTNNKWNKTTGIWTYFGLTNYTYFDPSEEQIAVGHIYHNIYPEKRYGYLITNGAEISKLTNFLETVSDGETHGYLMNGLYDKFDKTTWGDGYKLHFLGDGYGNTTRIKWDDFNFTGDVDFSGFSKLYYFSMHGTGISSADLSNNTALKDVYLYNNQMTSLNLSNCENLNTVYTYGNLLKETTVYSNKKNATITAGNNGAFYIKYNSSAKNPLTVIFKPDIGYKVSGFYNGNNKKIKSEGSTSYTMNPGYRTYSLKFTLDPDSYKYLLKANKNGSIYVPYNKALQTRLAALGYFTGTVNGSFGQDTEDAVSTFQRVNGVTVTGQVDKATWAALFNNSAVSKPNDSIIANITQINNLKLFVKATAAKGKITLTWLNIDSGDDYTSSDAISVGGYQIWRSTSSLTGYKKIASTKNMSLVNKSNLKKGTTYYYKVRAYKKINGKIYYSQWTKVSAKAK